MPTWRELCQCMMKELDLRTPGADLCFVINAMGFHEVGRQDTDNVFRVTREEIGNAG
jgi:hypothetical protein